MDLINTVTNKELFLMNLKLYMDQKGYSQKDLAKIVGFSQQQVSNLFNEYSEGVNTSTIDRISIALGFNETDLTRTNFKTILKNKNN